MAFLTGSGAPSFAPSAVGDQYEDTDSGVIYNAKDTRSSSGWVASVAASAADESPKKMSIISVGFAALNAAGSGVAALFGTAIPDNAIIQRAFIEISQTFAGDGDDSSTIRIGLEDQASDLVAAISIKNVANAWDAGLHECIPAGAVANMLKLSAARQLAVKWTAVATDTALVAGAMKVHVEWVQGA